MNLTKQKLAAGKLVLCMGIRQARTPDIAMLAMECGFDAIFADMEHSALGLETVSAICVGAIGAGVTPLVRPPSHAPPLACDAHRIIWGSDYPHLSFADKVGSIELYNLLGQWAPDEATRKKIFTDNPAKLFGFAAP
jgi:hypothetical protein